MHLGGGAERKTCVCMWWYFRLSRRRSEYNVCLFTDESNIDRGLGTYFCRHNWLLYLRTIHWSVSLSSLCGSPVSCCQKNRSHPCLLTTVESLGYGSRCIGGNNNRRLRAPNENRISSSPKTYTQPIRLIVVLASWTLGHYSEFVQTVLP